MRAIKVGARVGFSLAHVRSLPDWLQHLSLLRGRVIQLRRSEFQTLAKVHWEDPEFGTMVVPVDNLRCVSTTSQSQRMNAWRQRG